MANMKGALYAALVQAGTSETAAREAAEEAAEHTLASDIADLRQRLTRIEATLAVLIALALSSAVKLWWH